MRPQCRWASLTAGSLTMTLTAILLCPMLLVTVLGVAAESGSETVRRVRRQSSTCEAKYREYRATHTLCLEDNPKAKAVTLTQAMKDAILNKHNEYRAQVDPTATNMRKMVWDDFLARTAKKLVMQCQVAHDDIKDRAEPDWTGVKIGQNLGSGHRSFDAMLDRFYTEKDRLNFTYGDPYKKGTGHFIQMVDSDAARVGCGQASCPDAAFKVLRACNYAPALDSRRNPYKQGSPCADCPNHCDSTGKLCECGGRLCLNNGRMDVSTCQCKCQKGRTGDSCQDVDCSVPDLIPACRNDGYTKDDCGKTGPLHDPNFCPHLCRLCDGPCPGKKCIDGFVLDTNKCECSCQGRQVGGRCASTGGSCPEIKCKHDGVFNKQTCRCDCQGSFTGKACETCPSEDGSADCQKFTKAECQQQTVRVKCPYMCGVCLPGSATFPRACLHTHGAFLALLLLLSHVVTQLLRHG